MSPGLPRYGLAIWGPPWISERCVATEVHRIHAHTYGRQALTSRLFSLFRVWSQAKYVGEFAACVEEIIREEGERVCTPPPPEERAVVEALRSWTRSTWLGCIERARSVAQEFRRQGVKAFGCQSTGPHWKVTCSYATLL